MPSVTLDQANTILQTALARAAETECAPLAVAVLDSGGHLKAFARQDGAGILRPQIAIGKAWGALGLGRGSRAMAKILEAAPERAGFFNALSALSEGKLIPVAGGVLIEDDDGHLYGAVGISGDTSDKDEDCGIAGVLAVGLRARPE